jgi:hypothetical protein
MRNARRQPGPAATPATVFEAAAATTAALLGTDVLVTAALPAGTPSLFAPGAAALLAPLLDRAMPGEPTLFTSIDVFADHAVVIARDPDDPSTTRRATWTAAGVVTGDAQHEALDITPALFTIADLDWDVIAALVAAAPATAGDPSRVVTDLIVQRWGFDPAFPMRVLVHLDDGRFIEAAADGRPVAVH